ncbi:TPA: DUF1624 domain-containing protein [Klebsiella oxytoca]|nr:DUF1624 domain-containing protein [Klebsiella oxytoca]
MKITRNQDIDRMRGLTVFLMLVVNSPVDLRITNSALIHSEWAGLSLADTVFPMFLFIVGMLFFSVLFSSVICFTPYLIQKTMFFVKRAI